MREKGKVMASIWERKKINGDPNFRVRIRYKDKNLNLTFPNRNLAVKWIRKHEPLFRQDPDKYIKWAENFRLVDSKKRSHHLSDYEPYEV